jgi:predicted metal-dependent phosphoesterase TrpH
MAQPFSSAPPAAPVDFHLHSTASDGELPPGHVASAARKAWLASWALTDHDTLAGWRAIAGAPGLICGVEVTAGAEDREVHIVGLGIDPAHPGLDALLARIRLLRLRRIDALLARLPADVRRGLTAEAVKPPEADSVGRLHLAQALARAGGVASVRDAFAFHLADEHLADAELPQFPPIGEIADTLRAAGGVAILAHPGVYRAIAVATRLAACLDGLECAHPGLDPGLQRDLLDLCARRNLLVSVGSDTHRVSTTRRPGGARIEPPLVEPLLVRLGCPTPRS